MSVWMGPKISINVESSFESNLQNKDFNELSTVPVVTRGNC